jgi:hypothetical protein
VNKNLVFMADAREIRPGSRLFFSWNEFEPIFCAENDMDGVQDQSVRQCFFPPWHNILLTLAIPVSRLKALGVISDANPRLRRGLTCSRA